MFSTCFLTLYLRSFSFPHKVQLNKPDEGFLMIYSSKNSKPGKSQIAENVYFTEWYLAMWWFNRFFVANTWSQYLQGWDIEPGKWMFSTCFLRLNLWLFSFPQMVQLNTPVSWSLTMYSFNILYPVKLFFRFMLHWDMIVQHWFRWQNFTAMFACIQIGSGEMDAFNMLSNVTLISVNFSAHFALKYSSDWHLVYIFVEGSSCK